MAGIAIEHDAAGSEFRLMPKSAEATIASLLCEVEVVSGKHPGGVIRHSKIGNMILVRSMIQAGRVTTARSDRLIRRSTMDDFLLGMAVRGNPAFCQEGREAMLSPGEMVLIDSHLRYELKITEETEIVCLKIARRSIETIILEHGSYLCLPLKTDRGLGYVAGKMFEACIATSPFIGSSDGRRFESSFIGVMGSAFRCQAGSEVDPSLRHADKIFNRVREYIEDHLEDPVLGPSKIAQKVGLSERYMRKMFAARGITLMGWIRTRRIQKCHQEISSGSGEFASISEIAYAHGFNDISSFNRSFKSEFGVTPGEVRQDARATQQRLHPLTKARTSLV